MRIAAIVGLLTSLTVSASAGSYDGEWQGTGGAIVRAGGGGCGHFTVTMDVSGDNVHLQFASEKATYDNGTQPLQKDGTVAFKGQRGEIDIKFAPDKFKGSLRAFCGNVDFEGHKTK